MIAVGSASATVVGAPRGSAGALRALVQHRHGVPSTALERPMYYTRGSTLRSTMEFLGHVLPERERQEILARLAPEERALIERVGLTDDVPFTIALHLWRSADRALAARDPEWAERAGAEAIRVRGMQLYSGLIQKPTPMEFLAQHISLFQRYYRPGDMKITERTTGRATARLVGFEPGDTLFCRRLTGGWHAVIEIAGGRDTEATHPRCVLEGDPFCEWEIRWK
jgi:hypothetical protein